MYLSTTEGKSPNMARLADEVVLANYRLAADKDIIRLCRIDMSNYRMDSVCVVVRGLSDERREGRCRYYGEMVYKGRVVVLRIVWPLLTTEPQWEPHGALIGLRVCRMRQLPSICNRTLESKTANSDTPPHPRSR